MDKLENLRGVFTDKERMEQIWVDKGIKPVGETRGCNLKHKNLLGVIGFYTQFYDNGLLYSKNQKLIENLKHAVKDNDHNKEGELWGYPSCCTQYFSKLESKHSNPYEENLKTIGNRLKNNQFVPAYFLNYVFCPKCISTRESASGKLEDKMGEALKLKDYHLYEKFGGESNGRVVCLKFASGKDILIWDYNNSE